MMMVIADIPIGTHTGAIQGRGMNHYCGCLPGPLDKKIALAEINHHHTLQVGHGNAENGKQNNFLQHVHTHKIMDFTKPGRLAKPVRRRLFFWSASTPDSTKRKSGSGGFLCFFQGCPLLGFSKYIQVGCAERFIPLGHGIARQNYH